MKQISRLVVANDNLEGLATALEKATIIEHYTGAEIRVYSVIYDSLAEEPPEVVPAERRAQMIEAMKAAERNGLRNLAAPFEARVASLEAQVLWDKRPIDAIIEAVNQAGAQLLIKPVSEHRGLTDYLQTPLDWALMREAPCAVLVSKGSPWERPRTVIASVDVTDVRHLALCREILTTAATLAAVLGAPLHVGTAYPTLGQRVSELEVATDYEGIKADMRKARETAVQHWIESLALEVAGVHVLEGKAAPVIAGLANDLGATLTVVGTAARHGLGKLLLGNTAEDLISRIHGDVVTVREPWN
jgi:universal stress protein E